MTYITVKQASDLLKVHPNTIRNWIEAGILRRYQVSRGYRVLLRTEDIEKAISRTDIEDYKDKEG